MLAKSKSVYKGSCYHIEHFASHSHQSTVLIVFAQVNRADVLNLYPNRSFIAELLQQGVDVYLMSWDTPISNLGFEDYAIYAIDEAVDFLKSRCGHLSIMGVCQGGVMAMCYAAFASDKIKNLVTLVTPFDFHSSDNRLSLLARDIDVSLLSNTLEFVPGQFIDNFLEMTRPFEMAYRQRQSKEVDKEFQKRFNTWKLDTPKVPSKSLATFMNCFVKNNSLMNGNVSLETVKIQIANISVPILNVLAQSDHLWPYSSTSVMKYHFKPCQISQLEFPGGHLGLFISKSKKNPTIYEIANWLRSS